MMDHRNDPRHDDDHSCEDECPENLLTPDGLCPKCDEARRIDEQHIHEMTRDPQLEPW